MCAFRGGGSPPRKTLTDELEQVGAIASHMNRRLNNLFDGDRMRHNNGTAASQDEVPPRASSAGCSSPLPLQTYTPGVMALLQPSQPIPVSEDGGCCSFWTTDPPSPPAVAGGEDMDDVPAACTAEVENTPSVFLAAEVENTPSVFLSSASSHSSRPARRSVAAASPPIISQAKQQQLSVSDELRARMASVAKEDSQKNREHLLRMRLLRAESRDKAEKRRQVHDLEVENLKAKRCLIELKIQLAKKKIQ
ncbi:uncharacterized protein LOC144164248 [Haemaphysalis longicornis]